MNEQPTTDANRPSSGGAAGYVDWYLNRHELSHGMVFRSGDRTVMLLHPVPGDGTRWQVLDWYDGWFNDGSEIEPGELEGEPISDPAENAGLLST